MKKIKINKTQKVNLLKIFDKENLLQNSLKNILLNMAVYGFL